MKKVMGGLNGGGDGDDDGTICTSDSDCKTKDCGGGVTRAGYCYLNPGATDKTCHWGGC